MSSTSESFLVLADVGNLIFIIIVIVMSFITWISKVAKESEEKKRAAARGGRAGAPRDERLRTEIDAFLQEVADAKQGPRGAADVDEFDQPPPGRQQPPRQRPQRPEPRRPEQRRPEQRRQEQRRQEQRRQEQRRQEQRQRVGGAERRKPPRTSVFGGGLRQHVSEHIDSEAFTERVEKDVPQTIARSVAEHLGKFSSEEVSPEAEATPMAREMVQMLRNPSGIRQAVLLNEVLSPPRALRK